VEQIFNRGNPQTCKGFAEIYRGKVKAFFQRSIRPCGERTTQGAHLSPAARDGNVGPWLLTKAKLPARVRSDHFGGHARSASASSRFGSVTSPPTFLPFVLFCARVNSIVDSCVVRYSDSGAAVVDLDEAPTRRGASGERDPPGPRAFGVPDDPVGPHLWMHGPKT
jgi:hypothetical protein